jgi:predicted enzyme related to lactoylglutathione lyase
MKLRPGCSVAAGSNPTYRCPGPATLANEAGLGSAARAGVEAPSSYPTCILQDMAQSSAHQHHAIDYVELTVTDLEQAKRFYTQAFGWRFNDYGPEYAGIQSPQGGSAPEVGGLSKGQEVRSGGPLVLLYSTDLDRSVEAVKHAGGQVVNGPYAFPGGRRFHFTDPSGNELGVWAEA